MKSIYTEFENGIFAFLTEDEKNDGSSGGKRHSSFVAYIDEIERNLVIKGRG